MCPPFVAICWTSGLAERRKRGALAPNPSSVRTRLARYDWREVATALDSVGYGRLDGLLGATECRRLRDLYGDESRFRSFVDLGAHGYGDRGDYRYFDRPLPALVGQLRTQLYARLAPIANRWQERLGRPERFPDRLAAFVEVCHRAGQRRPTPLILRYNADGYNCLHQDLYGDVAFPLQVVVLLSDPERDFEAGAFLLTEQRPRMQSRGEAIELARGDALIFPNRDRPVEGKRGDYAATVRHGVSRILRGERFTLGLIFHDAK